MKLQRGNKIEILAGKYVGKGGGFVCFTDKYPLSDEATVQVRVQTGTGWKTLRMHLSNIKLRG